MTTPLPPGEHLDLLLEAIAVEGDGQRLLLAGEKQTGEERMRAAAELYWRSWSVAPPRSFGRLVGMLKAAVIGGDAAEALRRAWPLVREPESPAEAYACAICSVLRDDPAAVASATAAMRAGGDAFGRAADALEAIARRERQALVDAVAAIVTDFTGRDAHLTGVPIADTALMMERLAAPHGLSTGIASPLLPPT